MDTIHEIIHKATAWNQEQLIQALNPVIIGWSNYHRHIVAKETFQKLDHIVWNMLWRWAKRRHQQKDRRWVARRYWHTEASRNWVFKTETTKLAMFADTMIRRHNMVKLNKNPYLDRKYFLERVDKARNNTPWIQTRFSYFPYCRPANGL